MRSTFAAIAAASMLVAGQTVAQVNLSAETASPTGVPGNTVLALGEVAAKEGVANIQIAGGQTLTNSIQNVAEGKTDISASPFILPFLMSRGAGAYAALGKEKGAELASQLSVLYTYRLGTFALSAYDSENLGGYDDLAGRVIYNGPPRGGALANARAILKLTTGLEDGDGYTGLQVTWDQAVKTIKDGSADAAMLPTSFPDGRLGAASSSGAITIWSMPRDVFESDAVQKYASAPGSGAVEVEISAMGFGPDFTVISEDDMFRGVATVGGELVNTNMSFDLAKALTAAFLENMETYLQKTAFMPNVALGATDPATTGMCGAMPLKYHPGAVAAWEEAGYTLPDCAKP